MIKIFDFDGVLADPIEDTVFRLPENQLDDLFFTYGTDRYNIGRLCPNKQRLRHLILQEVLYERCIPVRNGPWFDHLEGSDPFFVLTARSGPGAVARVCDFFETIQKRPEEMFFAGPISKEYHLKKLSDMHPGHALEFYDDNQFHIDEANSLNLPNFKAIFVDNKVDDLMPKAMKFYQEQAQWLSSIHKRKMAA